MTTKSKKVIFRLQPEMYEFVHDFAKEKGLTVSEMCRNIMNYWYMAYFTGDLKINYEKLKNKFNCLISNIPDNGSNNAGK